MQDVSNVQEYVDTLPQRFSADGAKGMDAVFQFNLSGEDGRLFHVFVKDGTMEYKEGTHPSPTVTMNMAAADYIKMVNGKLNGQLAFMTGKLKVSGAIPIAMKMQQVFPPKK